MYCSVNDCNNRIKFRFPTTPHIKKKWLEAIKKPGYDPKPWHGLCIKHFDSKDLVTQNISYGCNLERVHLKKGSIPSVFTWSKSNTHPEKNIAEEIKAQNPPLQIKSIHNNILLQNESFTKSKIALCNNSTDCYEEIVTSQQDENKNPLYKIIKDSQSTAKYQNKNLSKKIFVKPCYDIEEIQNRSDVILEFTGLENYYKFETVWHSLGPKINHIKCSRGNSLSAKNQLFLTLWKLRKNCTDKELSIHFKIHKSDVGIIFKTWIKFMSKQWSTIDMWPSKDLINYYMPQNFRVDFPKTRCIIDGTEIYIERSKIPIQKQATFSWYKNDATLKTVVAMAPGGIISHASEFFGGSTSDRQVIERSQIQNKCEAGDLVMADKGFSVQDIFAPRGVTIATPNFKKGRGFLPLKELLSDRRLSKYRVHIERVIGQLKVYKILSTTLNHKYVPISNEILSVIVMLCNFRDSIMTKKIKK